MRKYLNQLLVQKRRWVVVFFIGGKRSSRVDEVEADIIVLHQNLTIHERGDGQIGCVLENFSAARLVDKDTLLRGRYGSHGANMCCKWGLLYVGVG